ncbi:hypothetical protein ASPZODRAFT_78173 [Penicilliopsis zonata CBS 506.65]|uniref:AMP-activated protein kinase glycogen-binding domain-containing protein n=1 Tax=Penicilliopsis zonata CBS 506.65 TaxID=1073090 RepID=A0A1L9S458_9EURO|nr:hypothetical protein ASPZODRAFT_78173 [Penicilliopsis zonata CBS 506.65]OJJ41965.1 hypothetical protein ASPZODRAFT_78173 [Penicilliopsis zonata CBS 506.65]
MAPVTISIRRPTDTPAVFVAGSFSEPQWELLELTPSKAEAEDDAEFVFSRQLELPAGTYHFRFREGPEGTWFHDKTIPNGKPINKPR